MRNPFAEFMKHAFIVFVLFFAFFPMYIMLNISMKNNKQFTRGWLTPNALSGIWDRWEEEELSPGSWDPRYQSWANELLERKAENRPPKQYPFLTVDKLYKKWADAGYPMTEAQARKDIKLGLMMPKSGPQTWHFENWAYGWNVVGGYIFNTVFVGVTAVFCSLTLSLCSAFFFARYDMPMKTFFWYFFLILMLMPGVANLIPLFVLLKEINLLNSLWALVIVGISGGQVMQIYILRNFIEEVPKDLFDAAEVDGASPLQQIWHIVVPMSGSILSTLAILQFIAVWNNFILPYVVIRDDELLTLAAGLVKLDGEYEKLWGPMMAGYSIAALPLVVIFIFTMRLFVKGIAAGAIKG